MYQVGNFKVIQNVVYVYINKNGTMEKLNQIKWYALLYLEILQGLNKYKSHEELKKYCNKFRRKNEKL